MITAPVFGAYNITNGKDEERPLTPKPGDQFIALDTKKCYICYERGVWSYMSMISSEDYTFENSQIPLFCSGSNVKISETQARTGTKCLRCLTRPYGSTPGDGYNGTAYGIEVLKISSLLGFELFFKSPDTDHTKTLSVKFYDEEHNLLQKFPRPTAYTFFKSENVPGDITVEMDIQWMSASIASFSLYVDDLKVDIVV